MTPAAALDFPASGPLLSFLAQLPPEELDSILAELSEEDAQAVYLTERYDWSNWARPEQLPPPGQWRYWICIAGRGGGKTRTGGEWANEKAERNPGSHGGLLGATKADVRDVMVEDPESGILACAPPWFRPRYEPSKRRLTWPNGATATTYSADEPEQTRGANLNWGWADEVGKYRQPGGSRVPGKAQTITAWENFILAVRIKPDPQVLVTTTPRRVGRGAEIVKDLTLGKKVGGKRQVVVPRGDPAVWSPKLNTIVHRWSMDRNRSNLADSFVADIEEAYAGTTLESQEKRGEILDDVEGVLWNLDQIDEDRVPGVPRLVRVLVSIDPAHAEDGGGDAAGIIVGGLGEDGDGYVWDDRTGNVTPLAWAKEGISAYNENRADAIVIEVTAVQTEAKGHVVKDTIKLVDPERKVKWIEIHASTDKRTRAEPVAGLYQQHRVHHVIDAKRPDILAALEDEMLSWDPTTRKSPNRLDALVHLLTELMLKDQKRPLGVS